MTPLPPEDPSSIGLTRIGRRAWLKQGSLLLAAAALPDFATGDTPPPKPGGKPLRIGLVTDLHYADKPPAGSRHYRETPDKLAEAALRFERERPDFVVELGDLIDAAGSVDLELRWLSRINRNFAAIAADRHYVLGNHCVDMLTKEEFLGGIEREVSYYSFDRGGFHFVVLDACFRGDGAPYGRRNARWTDANIAPAELEWLTADLRGTDQPVVVFAHQRLDVGNDHGVKNAPRVREILEATGRVLAVFQGHSHGNDHREINGIHYTTLVAMVEGSGAERNGYSLLTMRPDATLELTGFREQRDFTARAAAR